MTDMQFMTYFMTMATIGGVVLLAAYGVFRGIYALYRLCKGRKYRENHSWYGTGMSARDACRLVSSYFPHTTDEVKQMPKREVKRLVRTCKNYRSGVNGYIRFPTLTNGKKRQIRNPFLDRLDPAKVIKHTGEGK